MWLLWECDIQFNSTVIYGACIVFFNTMEHIHINKMQPLSLQNLKYSGK